ncbi:hypothetical protein ACH4SK_36540 [Streptomyces inhibens]|uniref:hypothetical protein n=1 Tax=Streptomyces inhibens TaxID=2293571 RepID=UPI0037A0A036
MIATITYAARALLVTHGFRQSDEQTMILARIDHEEHRYANQAARALRDEGITIDITADPRGAAFSSRTVACRRG